MNKKQASIDYFTYFYLFKMFLDQKLQGKQLKKLRKETFKLNQIELSECLGYDQAYLSRLESGKNPITHKIIDELSNMYNSQNPEELLNLNWLLLGTGNISIKDDRKLNIDITNSDNVNIGINGQAKQNVNSEKHTTEYEKEIAVLNEKIRGLETLVDTLKSLMHQK